MKLEISSLFQLNPTECQAKVDRYTDKLNEADFLVALRQIEIQLESFPNCLYNPFK